MPRIHAGVVSCMHHGFPDPVRLRIRIARILPCRPAGRCRDSSTTGTLFGTSGSGIHPCPHPGGTGSGCGRPARWSRFRNRLRSDPIDRFRGIVRQMLIGAFEQSPFYGYFFIHRSVSFSNPHVRFREHFRRVAVIGDDLKTGERRARLPSAGRRPFLRQACLLPSEHSLPCPRDPPLPCSLPGNASCPGRAGRRCPGRAWFRPSGRVRPSGVDRNGLSTTDLLRKTPKVDPVALFGAGHGVRGDIPAGSEFPDPGTGLRIFSLCGLVRCPPGELLPRPYGHRHAGRDWRVISHIISAKKGGFFPVCFVRSLQHRIWPIRSRVDES